MMKLLSFAALTYVAAAEVPVFSSNDDYDEINLNIRLLQGGNITAAPANSTEQYSYTVSGSLTSTYNTDKTVDGLCGDVAAPTCAALETSTGAAAGSCAISSCAAPAAASRARKLQADVSIEQAYALTFATAELANTASTTISSPAFASTFATALNSELTAAGTGLTATVDAVGPPEVGVTIITTAAPAAPAAPSPSPSSDATIVKADVALAAIAGLFASLF